MNINKKIISFLSLILIINLMTIKPFIIFADDIVIDERWGTPTFVYGSALNENQLKQTKEILKINNEVIELSVNGQDLVRLLGSGNSKANMYSSVLIKGNDLEGGVTVEILTPENITKVTQNQYANALITAGAKDVTVTVASPVKVTGESALTGVYKAYEDKHGVLDEDAMNAAQEELSVVTDIVEEQKDNEEFSSENLDMAIIEIKQGLNDLMQNGKEELTDEAIELVVTESINKTGLDNVLTEEQTASLVALAKKYAELDSLFTPEMQEQLDKLSNSVKEKTKELFGEASEKLKDPGFWEKVGNFIVDVFTAIGNFFVNIFSSDEQQIAPGPEESIIESDIQ